MYLIFKPNFNTTNVFLLYLCCVLRPNLVHLVLFSPIRSIWSYSVCSVYFGSIRSHSIRFGLIRSTLVLFGPLCLYSVHFVHFGLIRSNLVHYVHFGHILFIRSYLVLFSLFGPNQSTSVSFSPFTYIRSTSVLLV